MKIEKQRLAYLYQQYLNNRLSVGEQEEWSTALADESLQDTLKALLDDSYYAIPEAELQDMQEERSTEIFDYISHQGGSSGIKKSLWPRIAVAATVFLAIGAGIGFYGYQLKQNQSGHPKIASNIGPGKNTAILKLANGKLIQLSDQKTGLVIHADDLAYNDGTMVGASGKTSTDLTKQLSVHTPGGGTYQVVLSDGTKVWLNSASSIDFPAIFAANSRNRTVRLTGEAYFEVAKDQQHPFIVKTDNQEVEVLGTHFNVNSYPDEHTTTTTLLEGSVRISGKGINEHLKPGQQSVLNNKTNQLAVQPANLKTAIAWKNGYFRFDGEHIAEVMTKLSRWYNIEVVYQGPVTEEEFSGTISRHINLTEVLKMLSYSGSVQFKIAGRRVIVMQ